MDIAEQRSKTSNIRHPWERARCAFVLELAARYAPSGAVIDVGAGDGYVATALQATGRHVVAVDPHFSADDVARLRERGVDARTTAPSGPFSLALLLDVIEHVPDDVALLRETAGRLQPGGVLVVTVPAIPALFSSHDRALGHHRRYTRPTLRRAAHSAGLDVAVDGGLFHSLVAPRALSLLHERVRPRPPADTPLGDIGGFDAPVVVGDAITAVLRTEQRLSLLAARGGLALPGLSLFAVLRARP